MPTPETRESNMTVQILLSTYNGQRFLDDQLKSIAAQTVKDKGLLIRDDGSTDQTCDILKCFQQKYPWIRFYHGSNIGVQKSYLDLIRESDHKADYTAFSDQDDVWLPQKLTRALQCLKRMENSYPHRTPILYCSDARPVDEELGELHIGVPRVVKRPAFGNALVQNICTGCTAVANQALMELLRAFPPAEPEKIIMHDWWLYLVASCFGNVYYDKNAYILYRQHRKNVSGIKVSQRELAKYRWGRLWKPGGEIYQQAQTFQASFGREMKNRKLKNEQELLDKLFDGQSGFEGRIKLICDQRYFRQKMLDNVIFRGIVLMGKL